MSQGSSDDAVLVGVAGGVATLTLNRPASRNALSAEVVQGLRAGFDAAQADPSVRVLVLTNVGPTFCAGADLKAGGATGGANVFPQLLADVMDSPKPVVARIAGDCFAGGLGLAAACDLSVAVDTARFGFTEVRIGVAPAIISVVCLPKMRRGDAAELFLTGDRITAARAVEVGLVNRAVPADALDAAVEDLVGRVVLGGPLALAASKRLIATVPDMDRAEAFAATAALSASLFASDEGAEGMAAFREKRPAAWVPRA